MSPRGPLALVLALGLALSLALAPTGAEAGGGKGKGAAKSESAKKGAEGGEEAKPTDPRVVDLPVLVAPVVKAQRLVGYLYLGVRLMAKDPATARKLKENLPLVQDAALRALHAGPVDASLRRDEATRAGFVPLLRQAIAVALGDGLVDQVIIKEWVDAPF